MTSFKEIANQHFKNARYLEAMNYYTRAIEEEPDDKSVTSACYANRSFAACRLELYGQAVQDASKAIEIDPQYTKAYYRRAAALMSLKAHKEALKDFKIVADLQTRNLTPDKFIHAKIKECEKLIHRIAFEKAIAVEARNEKPLAYTVNCDEIVVESDYDGPRLEDEKRVTKKFIEEIFKHFFDQKSLHRKYALEIMCQSYKLFVQQPSLVDIKIPEGETFTVVGDIHGQYYDLLNLFLNFGSPSKTRPYLFNGDIVDRGSFSIECILVLLSLKLLFPDHFYIARGNHETNSMNQMYGFEGECKHKYSSMMFDFFAQIFQVLPLAHCLVGLDKHSNPVSKVLVMHGGLFSSDDVTLEDIKKIDRNKQPPNEGIMCEILWSDPMPQEGRQVSKRGIAIAFGPDVTKNFCEKNDLKYIIRSHEVKDEGFEIAHDGKCITVFSAPNYCDNLGNKGAVIQVTGPELKPKIEQFAAVKHPDMKPMAYANQLMRQMY